MLNTSAFVFTNNKKAMFHLHGTVLQAEENEICIWILMQIVSYQ